MQEQMAKLEHLLHCVLNGSPAAPPPDRHHSNEPSAPVHPGPAHLVPHAQADASAGGRGNGGGVVAGVEGGEARPAHLHTEEAPALVGALRPRAVQPRPLATDNTAGEAGGGGGDGVVGSREAGEKVEETVTSLVNTRAAVPLPRVPGEGIGSGGSDGSVGGAGYAFLLQSRPAATRNDERDRGEEETEEGKRGMGGACDAVSARVTRDDGVLHREYA